MSKRKSRIFVLCTLFSMMQITPISHQAAVIFTALSSTINFLVSEKFINISEGFSIIGKQDFAYQHGTKIGIVGLTSVVYAILYQYTPYGRYGRAKKIYENINQKLLHTHDFSDKNNIQFLYFGTIEGIDGMAQQLKDAESLLLAAKKDVSSELFESCGIAAQKIKFKFGFLNEKDARGVHSLECQRHKRFERKIDILLLKVRNLLEQIADIYASDQYMNQLKMYEELRFQMKKLTTSRFAVPFIAIAGSIAGIMISAGAAKALWGMKSGDRISRGKVSR